MSVSLAFLAVIAAIAGWWLARQRLWAKPWLEEGPVGEVAGTGAVPLPAAKLGLGVLLAVVGSLFALFTSAYVMRMHMAADALYDWQCGLIFLRLEHGVEAERIRAVIAQHGGGHACGGAIGLGVSEAAYMAEIARAAS